MSQEDDSTKVNTLLGSDVQQAVDHVILKRVGADLVELKSLVVSYHDEAISCSAKLDEHVRACDRRYESLQRTNTSQNAHIAENASVLQWVMHKLGARMFDYTVTVFVVACYFLYQHHFHLPAP